MRPTDSFFHVGRSQIPGLARIFRWFLVFGLTAGVARAAWSDITEGLDQSSAKSQVGVPLITNQSRDGKLQTWTYDHGASIYFEHGKVRFWQPPRTLVP